MILITTIWIICISICNGSAPSKIFRGTQVGINDYPYVVSIQWLGTHHCGGSIISRDMIITSASCVVIDTEPFVYLSNLQVLIGTDNNLSQDNHYMYSVKKVIPYKDYNSRTAWIHDIALLKLETEIIPFFHKYKISIAERYFRGTYLTAGWGGTSHLHKVNIKPKNFVACVEIFNGLQLTINQGCATTMNPFASLVFGDSGNPLIKSKILVGVISVFDPRNPVAIIFTKVYKYRKWINRMIETI